MCKSTWYFYTSDPFLHALVRQAGDELDSYLADAQQLSDFEADVQLDPNGRYIMLSTCAYLFDNDRYVLHGMLVPMTK